ncbi:hypothetical protein GGI25_003822 [Coemansia spiralis]|uniref:Uncharacterized protein n=2 Tax=Coemansia TaxID=4863 RepID=A0A9W8G5W3_9FUNG|nr:hypothetical protein EDC05_003689 [Coemansia umbellata]KAJ2620979.1 hypothetical protein GGI26_004479 [Coemansia sp. RSA 1358]KAJ2675728.1 hypothetical protein GGI25_003822 [Coemansia spiralis]
MNFNTSNAFRRALFQAQSRKSLLHSQLGRTRICALTYQLKSHYSNDTKRQRERVQFPWVWPEDSQHIPEKSVWLKVCKGSTIPGKFVNWYMRHAFRGLEIAALSSEPGYLETIQNEMIPLVLTRIVDAINDADYDQLDEIMTPYLAKLYKHALANMRAQGFILKIQLGKIDEPTMSGGYAKLGPPEAYDTTIPYKLRYAKYVMKYSEAMHIAMRKLFKEGDSTAPVGVEPQPSVMNDWLAFENWFSVKAQVKIELFKGGKVIDHDSGEMEIPITLATPHYHGPKEMSTAITKGDEAKELEPFRWKVADLFYIGDNNEAKQMLQNKQA